MNFFTYGTFRRNQPRHYVLAQLGLSYLRDACTAPVWEKKNVGGMYTGLVAGNTSVAGELYRLPTERSALNHAILYMNMVEGTHLDMFKLTSILLDNGTEALAYILTPAYTEILLQNGGFSAEPMV